MSTRIKNHRVDVEGSHGDLQNKSKERDNKTYRRLYRLHVGLRLNTSAEDKESLKFETSNKGSVSIADKSCPSYQNMKIRETSDSSE